MESKKSLLRVVWTLSRKCAPDQSTGLQRAVDLSKMRSAYIHVYIHITMGDRRLEDWLELQLLQASHPGCIHV